MNRLNGAPRAGEPFDIQRLRRSRSDAQPVLEQVWIIGAQIAGSRPIRAAKCWCLVGQIGGFFVTKVQDWA
jgi:hypothetical protein